MKKTASPSTFRIWITRYQRWQPNSWQDLPDEAVAVELAEPGCFTASDALAYIEGHNRAAMARRDHHWAVAVPVVLAYEGEPAPGDTIFPQQVALSNC